MHKPCEQSRFKHGFTHLLVATLAVLMAACASNPPATPKPASSVQQQPELDTEPPPAVVQVPDSPEIAALRGLMTTQDRLDAIAAPLLMKNSELCKKQSRLLLGFSAKNKYSYSRELADKVQAAFGLDERLQVTSVLAASGAARVGLQKRDIVLTAEDTPLPQGENAERQAAAILGPLTSGRSHIKLTISRDGNSQVLNIPMTQACAFRVELGNADHVNSYTDGRRIVLTRGLVNVAKSDLELAFAIAREMAHAALGHPEKQRMTGTVGAIIDNLVRLNPDLSTMSGTAGVKVTLKELDAAADILALNMLSKAGYQVEKAPQFWRRLASEYPASVLNGHTAIHPDTAYRLAAMDKTIAEIKAKEARQPPLLP
ncbi:MAG: M48 family metallopeptidase [Pseudomonadota bacterium]